MKNLIVISGKQYSGKDTLAKVLLEELKTFSRIGIGDAIKIMYAKKHDITFDEIEKNKSNYRTGLIELGDWGRAQDPDFWLKEILAMKGDIIVPDLRLQHELEVFKENNGFLIRVEASDEVRSKRGLITNATDATETALDNFNGWDYKIKNEGDLESLKINAKPLIKELKARFKLP